MEKQNKKRLNAEDYTYLKIKNAINKRYIRPGSQLVESSIAEQLGVSRTPVRAAIKRLEYEGFITIEPYKGAFLIKPTIEEIKQVYLVRIQLEKMACSLAAKQVSYDELSVLEELIEREIDLFDARDLENYYKVNDDFHLQIARISKNKVLFQYIRDVLNKVNTYLILFDPFHQLVIDPSVTEHTALFEALKDKDSQKSELLMEKHLNNSLEFLKLDELELNTPEDFILI